MTLETLFARAGICKWNQTTWFSACAYDGRNLVCSDVDDYASIERMFLEQLRAVNPAIVLVFAPAQKAAPRPASPFKKAYSGQVEKHGDQGDFFR